MRGRLKLFLRWVLLGLFLGLSGLLLGVWLGQDHIVALFVQEANHYLRTPVRVGRINVSLLDQFPRLSVTLRDVVVAGSLPQDTVPLARVRTLYCAFDVSDLLLRRYRIRAVTVADGQVQVRLDNQGRPNYDVIQSVSADAPPVPKGKSLTFALQNIRVQRVTATYEDQARQQRVRVRAPDLRATLTLLQHRVAIQASGAAQVQGIWLGSDAYFQDKEVTINTKLLVDRLAHRLTLQPSTIGIGPAAYGLAGDISYGGAIDLNLTFDGRRTDVQSVLALLPPRLSQRLSGYRSQGEVYFGGTVRGLLTKSSYPRVEARFGSRDASFYHPQYRQTAEHVYLAGAFSNGAQQAARTCALKLEQVRGTLQGRPFSGDLRYENFADPTVRLNLQADLDVARALRFYPVAAVRGGSGEARLAVQLAGKLREFRAHPAAVRAAGVLTVRDVRLQLRSFAQPFTGLSGDFRLQGNDVVVRELAGWLGRSDFRIAGLFKNALGWLLLPYQPMLVKADFTAGLLDFDQLLRVRTSVAGAAGPAPAARPVGYDLRVSPGLALDLNATVGRVRFRRFRGRDLRGTIRLRDQVLSSPTLSVAAIGGYANVRGTLDARRPELLKLSTTAACSQLPLDSLFYVFENFGQRFITNRHLRGTLTASAESDLYFDQQLTPLTNRLEAEVRATVRNGELNNFQPLQKLSMMASREKLRHLRFAELTNDFYIQSRTVYLPEMEVRSNVGAASRLRVTGTHTFDHQIDYHLAIPLLPGLLRRTTGTGTTGPNLLLAIQGTEDNFTVSYDRVRAQTNRAGPVADRAHGPQPAGAAANPALVGPAPATTAPRKLFELKKPEKKPTQPRTGEYFTF